MSESFYLVDEQEARLLAIVLTGCVHDNHTADRILCDLIELGLVNMDAGPAVYQAWVEANESDKDDLSFDDLVHLYTEAL